MVWNESALVIDEILAVAAEARGPVTQNQLRRRTSVRGIAPNPVTK